jgi:multidrug resistance efflux pump
LAVAASALDFSLRSDFRQRIRRGVFRSIADLQAAIKTHFTKHNGNPKPVVWTKSADTILATLDRLHVSSEYHAQEVYQATRLGPIREELAVADVKVKNAAASVIAARVGKLRIRAPSDGTVALIVAEPGEAIVPGQPLMTLEAAGRRWATFNLREDEFDGLRIGPLVELLPASGSNRIKTGIAEIIPRGEFATGGQREWWATAI